MQPSGAAAKIFQEVQVSQIQHSDILCSILLCQLKNTTDIQVQDLHRAARRRIFKLGAPGSSGITDEDAEPSSPDKAVDLTDKPHNIFRAGHISGNPHGLPPDPRERIELLDGLVDAVGALALPGCDDDEGAAREEERAGHVQA